MFHINLPIPMPETIIKKVTQSLRNTQNEAANNIYNKEVKFYCK